MTEGLLLELGHLDSRRVTQWVAGVPKRAPWLGLKLEPAQLRPVVSYGRPACGYLESYARARAGDDPDFG